jgi:signal peptidase I
MSVSNDAKKKNDGGIIEIVSIVVQALLLAILVQMFLFQPFNIPSGSMEHTLRVGDYLFVSKWSYGYSRYSFSNKILGIDKGIIPFSGRIWGADPKRGDIVVFRKPHEEDIDYIKRVIGLPGDKIQVKQGELYINGEEIKRTFDKDFDDVDYRGDREIGKQYTETLPNGISYHILKLRDGTVPLMGGFDPNNTQIYEVPPGHYFMMGDNRDNSADSRFLSDVGYVPAENLIGKAQIIFFSHEGDDHVWEVWNWPWTVRWDRIFKIL